MSLARRRSLLALALASFAGPARGVDLHVPSPLFPTVQSAVDAAASLDRILVGKGHVEGTVTVAGKSLLSIIGSKGARLSRIVLSFATDIDLVDLRIEGESMGRLHVYDSSEIDVLGCRLVGGTTGVFLDGCGDVRISRVPLDSARIE